MKRTLILIISLVISHLSEAQVFIPKTISAVPAKSDGAIDVGDYDNDGDLDFAVTGQQAYIWENSTSITGGVGYTGIFKNTNGQFTEVPGLNLLEARLGDIAWGDFDNDNDLDLIVSGHPTGPNPINTKVIALYKNNGNDKFQSVATDIIPFSFGQFRIVDFDRDGLLDIGVIGSVEGQYSSVGFSDVYKNLGNFNFQRMNLPIAQVTSGVLSFIDIENDGDWDVILNGFDHYAGANNYYQTYFYLNNNNTLTLTPTALGHVGGATLGVHDLNNDGFDDVVLLGYDLTAPPYSSVFQLYMNNNGTFQKIQTDVPGLKEGSIDFADFDNDHDIDLLITGATDGSLQTFRTKIVRNDGGTFTTLPNLFEGSFRGGAEWGDFDLDGDYDFIKFPSNTVLYSRDGRTALTKINTTICSGTSYTFDGQELTQSGVYEQVIHVTSKYDSTIRLTLTVTSPIQSSVTATICSGLRYSFGGSNLTSSGVYTHTMEAVSGCDSVITLTLTVTPPVKSSTTATICTGATYLFDGDVLSASGVYTKLYTIANGCDSLAEVTLNVIGGTTETRQEGSHLHAVENHAEYQWYNCDTQQDIAGETGKIFKVMKDGNYAVTVKKDGCISKSECVFAKSIFANYPSPAENTVSIKLHDVAKSIEVQMFDKSGVRVALWNFSNVQEFELSIDTFPDGQYFIQINADGEIISSKIIKKGK